MNPSVILARRIDSRADRNSILLRMRGNLRPSNRTGNSDTLGLCGTQNVRPKMRIPTNTSVACVVARKLLVAPRGGAENCDEQLRLSVRLSACVSQKPHVRTAAPIFGCPVVLGRWRCKTLCTSGADNVVFSYRRNIKRRQITPN